MRYDVAIVGAGMAGASLAAEIAPHCSVAMLEAEDQPGYHSTGRSASFWDETYGGPAVQPLTSASGRFLAEHDLLHERGALYLGRVDQQHLLDDFMTAFAESDVLIRRCDRADIERRVPGLDESWIAGIWVASCADIDVAALHALYLKAARQAGATLMTSSPLREARRSADAWHLDVGDRTIVATTLVNAAGAWADDVARLAGAAPIGLQPYRRTIAQIAVDPPAPAHLPLVLDIGGGFYFKPEVGGRLWLSPHDETLCPPGDVAAEEIDIAIAIDRLQSTVDWTVLRVEHSWAGLRSFAPDRLPVYGFDPVVPRFFWCAGQGGFGIQTAPAAARLAAAMLLGLEPDAMVAHIDPKPYLATRFAKDSA